VKPRRWHLWHRDPWGAARHPYTDDERQRHDARLEMIVAGLIVALGLIGLAVSA
jgi:hypothetical protein